MTEREGSLNAFDLSQLNAEYSRQRRAPRVAGALFATAIATVMIAVVVIKFDDIAHAITAVSAAGVALVILLAIGTVMTLIGVSLFVIANPDLTTVRLTDDGLSLARRGKPERLLNWGDPKVRFRLENYQRAPPASTGRLTEYYLLHSWFPTCALSEAAYLRILDEARHHGMAVDAYVGRGASSPDVVEVHYPGTRTRSLPRMLGLE